MAKPSKNPTKQNKVRPTKQDRLARNAAANVAAQTALAAEMQDIRLHEPTLRQSLRVAEIQLDAAHEERRQYKAAFNAAVEKHNTGKMNPQHRTIGSIGEDYRVYLWNMYKDATWERIENNVEVYTHNVAVYKELLEKING